MFCVTNLLLLILSNCIYNIIRFFYNLMYAILCIEKYSKNGSVVFHRVHSIKRSPKSLHPQSLPPSFLFPPFHFFFSFLSIFLPFFFPSFLPIPSDAKHGGSIQASVCSDK